MNVEILFQDTQDFIKRLDVATGQKVLHSVELLEQYGASLGQPQSKALKNGLFELRVYGKSPVRLFYAFHLNTAYILHGIVKKTWRIPARDLELAIVRKKLLQRT